MVQAYHSFIVVYCCNWVYHGLGSENSTVHISQSVRCTHIIEIDPSLIWRMRVFKPLVISYNELDLIKYLVINSLKMAAK
jgi:hypothetical protein